MQEQSRHANTYGSGRGTLCMNLLVWWWEQNHSWTRAPLLTSFPALFPFSFLRSPFHAPRSSFSSKHYLQNVTFSFWSLMGFVYLHIALGISSTPQPAHTNAISLNIFQIITRQVSFRKPSQPSYRASHVTTEIWSWRIRAGKMSQKFTCRNLLKINFLDFR